MGTPSERDHFKETVMGSVRVGVLLGLAVMSTSAGGCAGTKFYRVARFSPGEANAQVLRPAPQSTAYRVKYADADATRLSPVRGTKRIVARGEPLGFVTFTDGKVFAVAGQERIPLDNLPESTRYCVWTAKEKRTPQFTREVGKAVATAATVTAVGVAAGAIGIGAAALAATDHDDGCDRDSDRNPHHHEHQPHPDQTYRWGGPVEEAKPQPPAGR
jgi:hypothetical protein